MPVALRSKPRPRKPANPAGDPRFQQVINLLKQKAAATKKHPPAAKKAAEAAQASKGPPNEKKAGAKATQAEKIPSTPTASDKPKTETFLEMLRAQIQAAMPKNLKETETFMKGGDASGMKSTLKGNVQQQTNSSKDGVESATKATPNEGAAKAKDVTAIPPEPGAPPPLVDGGAGMPSPKDNAEVSLQDSKQDTGQAMKDAEVTDPQLKKANDPRFSAVADSKDAVGKQADAGPPQYRAGEQAVIAAAKGQAKAQSQKGAAQMTGVKKGSKTKVLTRQEKQKLEDEKARQKVATDIENIYNATKLKVETRLTKLEETVNTIFDTGTEAALTAMTDYVEDKILNYKLNRYLSIPIVGAARWIRDQFKGLPEEANAFYTQGRAMFTRLMDAMVVRVAALVERELQAAKNDVKTGQNQIKTYVNGLAPNLKTYGEAAQKEVSSRFSELEQGIEDKKSQLAQALAQKYKEGFDKADAKLKEIQDANKGLVAAFIEKLGEIIKILAEFKDKLMGVLKKGWETIKLILADPIGFLGNLLSAIKQGISQFVGNIWAHLKKGFMEWLFGSLASAGIEIPADLSLGSIFKLVLGVLGLTPARIEQEAVKLLGPTAVTVIKKLIEYVRALIKGGPKALWEKVQQDIGDLKAMIIDAIQDWLITTIIKQATIKMLSLFNPAGAFIQACILIVKTVMWIINNATRILDFVAAVVESAYAIATGAIGGAANWIEQALARMIPLVIGFLADLIGLGGISAKIREFITKVQDKVWGAIRKALKKIIDTVKKLIGKLFGKKDKKETEHDKKVNAGLADIPKHEAPLMKDGKLRQGDAESVAAKVKQSHPVFKSISVVESSGHWKYNYVASTGSATGATSTTKPPDKRHLPPGLDVRQHLYENGSGFGSIKKQVKKTALEYLKDNIRIIRDPKSTEAVKRTRWANLVRAELVPAAADRDKYTIQKVNAAVYHVDHIKPLAIHWRATGFNCGDGPRQTIAGTAANLHLILGSINLSKGGEGAHYADKFYVGPNFSSDYNNSPTNSLKIKGKSFRDDQGKALK